MMDQQPSEPSRPAAGDSVPRAAKKPWDPPTLHTFGTVGDLTKTLPAGPNFDGGGGANIYTS